eukprot:COSAG06_NODE_2874_length_6147_cov_3.695933_2_plen_116_part_00
MFLQALGSCEGAPGDAGWEVRNHTGGGGPGYAHFPGFSLSIASVNECRAKCCADAHCVSITLGPTAAAAAKEEDVVPTPANIRALVYKPKDLDRDWSPRFSTLRDKNGWVRVKTA